MTSDAENKVKIRFKFRSGEEFEAEGSPEFIEKQRADFLHLIGKETQQARFTLPNKTGHTTVDTPPFSLPQQTVSGSDQSINDTALSDAPAALRRGGMDALSASPSGTQSSYIPPNTLSHSNDSYSSSLKADAHPGHTAAEGAYTPNTTTHWPANSTGPWSSEMRLWEEIAKTENGLVILRRKSRLLSPETAALLLIGAAKVLLQTPRYTALALAKSLAKSGYAAGRLDRVLAGEIKRGTVQAFGSKRSRCYLLSDEGFARAFVLAGKLAAEWR